MNWLHFACYAALAVCTTLPSAPEANAMIYVMLACMALVHDH
jgi:hypothetical protein